ncbi:10346_t:CDS:2 [Gigaspora rosea]|nr:10346_t:CDS:2 [Gigaspora rosea]
MKYYVQCVYAATACTNDPNLPIPTKEDLFKMQTEGVIAHLQNNHKDFVLKDLKQYIKLSGQGLITTIRTSANEAVNLLHNNDNLLTLLKTVRKVAKLPEFSEQDIISIIKIWKSRNDK